METMLPQLKSLQMLEEVSDLHMSGGKADCTGLKPRRV